MKPIILSIYILLLSSFFLTQPIYSQADIPDDQEVTIQQENSIEEINTVEEKTVAEELQEETSGVKLSFGQILISILAPASFIVIAYLLIKKLKL